MATYSELRTQIEKLEAEATAQLKKEVKAVIADIKSKMEAFRLTAADLGLVSGKARRKVGSRRKSAVGKRKGAGKAKYRDPSSGATWTGFGRAPRWLTDAEAAGKKREKFLIG